MSKNAVELVQNKKSLELLQLTFLGSKAKHSLETYSRPEQTKSFPQGGKIQNGDTRNHQDLPPTRGVGYLNRFEGCLLPYTNTGTIQKISESSHPGSDIPVNGTAIRFVHSIHRVHCSGKGGETDGHTQGYKDPPVPRRLVGESQVPPSLFPAYIGSSKNVSGTRLAGESTEIRAGAQTSLRLCRLPVRPQIQSDLHQTVGRTFNKKYWHCYPNRLVQSSNSCL